jgi:hypothetical protein
MDEMRRTIGQTKEALEFTLKVDQLTPRQREHLRLIIERVVDCCLNADLHGMVLISRDTSENVELFMVNSTEMDAAVTLSKMQHFMIDLNMADAPEQGMMN